MCDRLTSMREDLQVSVNGRRHRVTGALALVSLADFLRNTLRLTGTKSACNQGDCGACTVLVGHPSENGFHYQAINSCIQFMYQLDGSHVVTIEGLASQGCLPLATALAKGHGVQCGFCTPGIVMAMTAARNESRKLPLPWTPAAVRNALTGNLCRCTGYAQIVEALSSAPFAVTPVEDLFPSIAMATETTSQESILLQFDGGTVFLPATLDEALAYLVEDPDAVIVSGATDVGAEESQRGVIARNVLYIGRIPGLTEVSIGPEFVTVGACTSLSRVTNALEPYFPEFAQMLERFGSAQIRNCATLGGNLANGSSIADCIPFLFAEDAEVELISIKGPRRMPVEDFLTSYKSTARNTGEIISRVFLPRPGAGSVRRLYKVSRRRHLDIGTVTAAIVTEVSRGTVRKAHIAFGGVGPTVVRLRRAEAALEGNSYCLDTFMKAGQIAANEANPQNDLRGSAEYRRLLVSNLLRQYYWDTLPNSPNHPADCEYEPS